VASLLSYINLVDTGTVTAASESSTLPSTNLKDKRVSKPWRALATTTSVSCDFGSAVAVRVVAMLGCNLSSTDTWRIRLSAVSAGAGELLDTGAIASGVQAGYEQAVYLLAASVNARYLKIDIVATSRASIGTFDVGRLWAGSVWAPTIGIVIPWDEGWVDLSEAPRARRSGVRFNDEGAQYRTMNVSFEDLSDAERLTALAIDQAVGKQDQVLFIPDSTAALATSAIMGRMPSIYPSQQRDDVYPARFAKQFAFEQDL
jgi:hypothetical protein